MVVPVLVSVPLTMPLVSCNASGITWTNKSCHTHSNLQLRNAVLPLMMCLASHDTNAGASGITWSKSHVIPHFNHIDLQNAMVLLVMLAQMASHDQKGNFAPHFNCLDLRNAMVPLTMLLASCDTSAIASGFTWPKKSCCTSFWLSYTKKWMLPLTMLFGIRWHWCQCHLMM